MMTLNRLDILNRTLKHIALFCGLPLSFILQVKSVLVCVCVCVCVYMRYCEMGGM